MRLVRHRVAGDRALDRRCVPCMGRIERGRSESPAPGGGARGAKPERICGEPRSGLANDGQRLSVLHAHQQRTGRKARHREAGLLDRAHARRRRLGVIRKTAAVVAGKATGALSRATGPGGGTTLPGDVARAIDPRILTRLTQDLTQGSIVITGTNGKTTTARLISWLLEGAGHRVVANRAGANLIYGVTAAALNRAGTDGKLKADWGVFEIDEASLPRAVDEIQPQATLVLNLFRDQLDRYGELESIARRIEGALSGVPESGHVLLNSDDPRVAEIGLGLPRQPTWFGLDDTSVAAKRLPHAADARTCPRCGASLIFEAVYVGHDGVYRCPNGHFDRPRPEIAATNIALGGFESLA